MKCNLCVFVFLFVCTAVFSQEALRVELPTKSSLMPLYLNVDATKAAPDIDKELISALFAFDFHYNSQTSVADETSDRKEQLKKESFEGPWDIDRWNSLGVNYVLRIVVDGHSLKAKVCDLSGKKIKTLENIELPATADQLRKKIHNVSDAIFSSLFHSPGVASTTILFSKRERHGEKDATKWISEIWICDWDGGNARKVTSTKHYALSPTFMPAPAGYRPKRFYYTSYELGQPKIFSESIDGGQKIRFTRLPGNQLMPAVNKNRTALAFVCDAGGNPDLYIQELNAQTNPLGKPRQIFSTERGTQASPSFHPDGSRLAFVSNKDGVPRVYVIDIPPLALPLRKVKATLISKQSKESTSPSWSPDGKKLAYSSMTQGVRQIWIYDFETRKEWQLTFGSGNKENPSWAPDSMHLIFNLATPTKSELLMANLNQGDAVQLNVGDGEKRFPAWEPLVF